MSVVSTNKQKYTSRESAEALLRQCDNELIAAHDELQHAKELATRAGLWTADSTSILDSTFPDVVSKNMAVLKTTGGHSNTNHVVTITGDARTDRIQELKRAMQKRVRTMQPETKGQDRWDKPRIPGERRRRILRERDMPQAPPEPPPSGYVIFVGQMTTKIRHDCPEDHHNQIKVVKEIGRIWRYGISQDDRQYYDDFAREARAEYQEQFREYRATGRYTRSKTFEKLEGGGVWVRIKPQEKNGLEREIDSFASVKFPPRPPEMEQAFRKRGEESKRRRKEKIKAMREQQQKEERAEEELKRRMKV